MKKKLPYILVSLLTLIILSCSNKEKKNSSINVTADSVSAELSLLNKQINEDPDNSELYNARAKYFIEKKQLNEALSDINKAITLDSLKAEYFLTLSDIYFAEGRIKNCQAAIQKSIKINPKYSEGLLRMAELQLYFKEYNKSIEYVNKAIDVNKINAKAYFIKGMTYKEYGDTAKAVLNFQTAVDQDGEYYHAYIQLGLIFAKKQNKLAVDYYNNALYINPKSIEALYGLGMYFQENFQYKNAIAAYDSIISIDPQYKQAYFNLGYIHLVYQKNFPKAIKHFSDAITIDPEYAEAFYNRGYAFELSGNFVSARNDYKKALEYKTNYDKAINGLNRLDKLK